MRISIKGAVYWQFMFIIKEAVMKRNYFKVIVIIAILCMLIAVCTGCTKNVEDMEYAFSWNASEGETYDFNGKYTGIISYNVPNGQGVYEAGKEDEAGYFCYEGEWAEGVPNGEGTLYRVNEGGEEYTYKGNFKEGMFDGHGELIYDDDSYWKNIGNFSKGVFKPTLAELVAMHGTAEDSCEYTLSDSYVKFLNSNEDLFTSKNRKDNKSKIKKAGSFNAKEFQKDPSEFEPEIVKVPNLNVIQIKSYAGDYEKKETYAILTDSYYEDYYFIYYNGKANGILEDDVVDLYFLPVGYSTYETVSGADNYAIAGQAALIEK